MLLIENIPSLQQSLGCGPWSQAHMCLVVLGGVVVGGVLLLYSSTAPHRTEPLSTGWVGGFKIGYARDCSGSGAQWMCDCCC